jgi:uncharacterized surface protein with fasciclin (FAS1) repeats
MIDNKRVRVICLTLSLSIVAGAAAPVLAAEAPKTDKTVLVGGAPMYPSKNIVENATHSKDHTTLVAAVKAAGLVDTLSGAGPFTVFAPTNEAFAALPAGTLDTLEQPANKASLTNLLSYHVVAGRYTAKDLTAMVKQGGGKASLTTVQGEPLLVMQAGKQLEITDAKGNIANVTIDDVMQSNGVIHVVDKVLML